MLFVGDDKAQFVEPDVFRQKRVGADNEVDVPLAQIAFNTFFLGRRGAPRQEFNLHVRLREELLHGLEVLFREDLGRSHHGGLVAVLRR